MRDRSAVRAHRSSFTLWQPSVAIGASIRRPPQVAVRWRSGGTQLSSGLVLNVRATVLRSFFPARSVRAVPVVGPCEVYQDGSTPSARWGETTGPPRRAAPRCWAGRARGQAHRQPLGRGGSASRPVTTSRSWISQLRKTLRTAGSGQRIITRAPGYRIELAPGELDLHRFEGLASQGRAVVLGRRHGERQRRRSRRRSLFGKGRPSPNSPSKGSRSKRSLGSKSCGCR